MFIDPLSDFNIFFLDHPSSPSWPWHHQRPKIWLKPKTLTKILFLAFFYSTIFPATYFFAAVAFFVNYYVDKFSILRIWAAAPRLGTQVSEFSRKYFLNGCVIALAFMSSYMLSAFPYDNLCGTCENWKKSSLIAKNISLQSNYLWPCLSCDNKNQFLLFVIY